MPENYVTNPCNYYFAALDANGYPLPSTMRLKHSNNYDTDNTPCTETRLTPYQTVAPAGKKQCFPPNRFRYFYQFNPQTKQILPNSLISRLGKPDSCKGTNQYLEWKKFG